MNKKAIQISAVLAIMVMAFLWGRANYLAPKELTLKDFKAAKIEAKKGRKAARPGYPDKLLQWYYEQRAYATGQIPQEWRSNAFTHIEKHNISLKKTASSLSWAQLGPGNVGGRIRSIIVDPANSNVIYVGSVSGGIWKTINGGNSWFPLKDNMENLSISSLVMDPHNSNVIYAGTGEGFYNYDAIRGEGIFKSTDAGASWTRLSPTTGPNFYYVNRLAIDKTTGAIWAATRNGLFRSADGGNTFFGILQGSAYQNCTDIKIAYTNPPAIYASFGLFSDFKIYKSTDGGNSFQQSYSYAYSQMGRTEMAVSGKNPNVVYLSSMEISTSRIGIMRVTGNSGAIWDSMTVAGGTDTYASSQAWYNNVMAVDPDNENTIYAAGLDLYRSKDKGATWQKLTDWAADSRPSSYPYVHADNHAIAFDPNNSNIMYIGNDGGIFKSTNKGLSWKSLNNELYITQFYYGAVDPKSNLYYGGTQDNGTLKSTNGGTNWIEILGGDGGAVEVDYSNPNIVYMEYVNLAFYKSTDGGSSYTKMMNGIPAKSGDWEGTTDRVEFIAPFVMDPNDPKILVAGTYKVYKTTNGAGSWAAISGDLTGEGTGSSGAKISALAIAKGNSNVIYAACTNGRVQVTLDNGASWNLRNSGLPVSYAKRIAINSNDPASAYVVYSGFSAGNKVYKTTDYGQTWSNITGDLPNIPVNSVLINPSNDNNLIVGTDLGIFSTVNAGKNWVQENNGLANVSVSDLDYRASDNKVFASTHGRGMFSAVWNSATSAEEKPIGAPQTFDISQNYPNPFNPVTNIRYQIPSPKNVRITVYDAAGRQVREIINEYKHAGSYEIIWDGTNQAGSPVSSGIYIYTIQAGKFSKTMKMIMLK